MSAIDIHAQLLSLHHEELMTGEPIAYLEQWRGGVYDVTLLNTCSKDRRILNRLFCLQGAVQTHNGGHQVLTAHVGFDSDEPGDLDEWLLTLSMVIRRLGYRLCLENEPLTEADLVEMSMLQLLRLARSLGVDSAGKSKTDLVKAILEACE